MPVLLTDFVNFVTRTGTSRVRAVRDVQRRTGYLPRFDYWKTLRDAVRRVHQSDGHPSALDDVIERLENPAKIPNYQSAIAGYKKFWGRKQMEYFDPPRADHAIGGLEVRVNPELGLYINGVPHIIKLYFRCDPLPRQTADIITHVMELALREHVDEETIMGVLDVQRGKLYTATEAAPTVDVLLEAEADEYARLSEHV